MRVLCLVPGPPFGGAERLALRIAELLRTAGCQVRIMTALDANHAPGALRSTALNPSRKATLPLVLLRTRQAMREFRPDVVYAHNRWHAAVAGLARPSGISVVLHCHSHLAPKRGVFWGDRTIAVSPSVARHVVGLGAEESRVAVVRTGLPETEADAAAAANLRSALRIPSAATPFAVYVGRMIPSKGPQVLLDALAAFEGFTVFAGDGPLIPLLHRQVAERSLGHRVQITGFLSQPHLLYASAAVSVVPSLEDEGLPLSVLESFREGVPVVGSRVAGVVDIVRQGMNGLLVPPGDPGALADALQALLMDPGHRSQLAAGARDTFRQFSEESMLSGVLAVLREASSASQSRRPRFRR